MPVQRIRLATALGAVATAAVLLGGCVGLTNTPPVLTQPGGVGAVHLRFSICTLLVEEAGESFNIACGEAEGGEGQFFVGLVVPSGVAAPSSIEVTPAAGSPAIAMTRNEQVGQAIGSNPALAESGTTLAPAGFELVGYISSAIPEPTGQKLEWTLDTNLGLPPGAGGGSYGGPFKVGLAAGWREVGAKLAATRPLSCSEEAEGAATTFCGAGEPVSAEIGSSDLKIAGEGTGAGPGTKTKVLFTFDFASSATVLPSFSLRARSNLPGAALRLSNSSFSRAPSNTTTRRAPPTPRYVTASVPANAKPGTYQVTLTATAGQGGVVTGVGSITVKPPLKARLTVPRRVSAKVAWKKGLPLRVVMPTAVSRATVRVRGAKQGGLLAKKALRARLAGRIGLRLKIAKPKVLALLAAKEKLTIEATVTTPGTKARKLRRNLLLR